MNRIGQLEALLERVQARAQQPRPERSEEISEAFDDVGLEGAAQATAFSEVDEPLAAPPVEEADTMDLDEPGEELVMEEVEDIEIDEVDEVEDIDLDDIEPQPESGPKRSSTMEEAMDAAEHQPPLTPPPESGEEVTSPQIPPQPGPTMEQLGQTISLDEGNHRDFELERSETEVFQADEFETEESDRSPTPASASVARSGAGVADEALRSPPEAREELDEHRLGAAPPIEARVASRPAVSTEVVALVSASKEFEPKSFLELLDASLDLR